MRIAQLLTRLPWWTYNQVSKAEASIKQKRCDILSSLTKNAQSISYGIKK